MEKNDAALIQPVDPLVALVLLTRLPVMPLQSKRQAQAAWAYPLAGLVVGGMAALVGLLALGLGLPPAIAALLALAMLVIQTGAMHEDGLADTADGLWGGWNREARLEIMRDSRIGTYGVIALCLSLAARWIALWMLYEADSGIASAALLASAAMSRTAMPILMTTLPHARKDGLSRHVGQVGQATAAIGLGLSILIAFLLLGGNMFPALLWAGLVVLAVALLARAKIGGQTGDILGASQQMAEIAILFTLLS